MTHVVMFSGGIGSWATARRVREAAASDDQIVLLFADTLIEDVDLYRFIDDAAQDVGAEVTRVSDGRTPWEVFKDSRFLGNTRADPCSRILKRELLRTWLDEHHDPANTVVYLGIDWSESHLKFDRAEKHWAPWTVAAPLCDPPYQSKADHIAALRHRGIEPPRLYAMGFPHNNCGGFCIKAGQAHFQLLLRVMPERYAYHEEQEEALRAHLEKDVAILRDRTGGTTSPMTLRTFRERLEAAPARFDELEWGGCGCFDTTEGA